MAVEKIKVQDRRKALVRGDWPVEFERPRVEWFPASSRLIDLVRTNVGNYVLPPAVVRKASWRD